jgi:hypothetical protein
MLDVNDAQNIGQVATLVLPRVSEHFIIDHHENEGDILAGNFVQKSASSTAEILHPLFAALGVQIDYPMALALYTAIVYDTGSFIYPKTTALTFGIARDLVERGVEPNVVYANVYEKLDLGARAACPGAVHPRAGPRQPRGAADDAPRDDRRERGSTRRDQFINFPQTGHSCRVLQGNPEGLMRCSMRPGRHRRRGDRGSVMAAATAPRPKCREPLAETCRAVLMMPARLPVRTTAALWRSRHSRRYCPRPTRGRLISIVVPEVSGRRASAAVYRRTDAAQPHCQPRRRPQWPSNANSMLIRRTSRWSRCSAATTAGPVRRSCWT